MASHLPFRVILLLLGLASGAFGAFRMMRAAFGLPKKAILDDLAPPETGRSPASRVRQWRRQQSEAALRDLKAGIVATFATLAFMALAVGFTWYVGEEPPAFVKATAGGQAVCGELKKGTSAGIIIAPADGEETTVAIRELTKLQVVSEC